MDIPAGSKLVACNLEAAAMPDLAARAPDWHFVNISTQADVWAPPAETSILVTFARGWRNAPKERPAGWPGKIAWLAIASAGTDAFPDWAFDVPVVTTGRGIASPAIAEYVMAAVLAHEKRFFDTLPIRRAADWRTVNLGQVEGRKLGLFGFGTIGQELARRALAFGMEVAAMTGRSRVTERGVSQFDDLGALAGWADHLVICAPLTPQTHHIVNAALLARAKPGLHLINVARGGLVDTDALLAAISSGHLAAATLDVTDPEPLPEGHPLYLHPNVRITPHISYSAPNHMERTLDLIVGNLAAWQDGAPLRNVLHDRRTAQTEASHD